MKSRLKSTNESYKSIKKHLEEIDSQLRIINHDLKVMDLFTIGNRSMYEEWKMYKKIQKQINKLTKLLKNIND